jgi:competence protein ComEC
MRDLTDRPLVCMVLGFAGGIALTAGYGRPSLWGAGIAASLSAVAWGVRRRPVFAGVVVLAAAALAGGWAYQLAGAQAGTDVSRLPPGGQTLVGTVAGVPQYSDGWWRFVLAVEEHGEEGRAEPVGGQVYVRFRSSHAVQRGQRWRLTGRLRTPREERNPGGRAEASRIASLGVTAVLTVGTESLGQPLGSGRLGVVSAHAYAAQRRALGLLGRFIPGPYGEQTAVVASSVIFGVHATPPPSEISDDFRRAGTIHLLVVSGAMVSMLFGFVFLPGALGAAWRRSRVERQMAWPLSGRGRVRHWPGISAAIIAVLVVIYYAALTEGGQAVARAAIMGVMVGAALVLRRVPAVARAHGLNVDHYTLLAVAGLGVLAVQPEALFQPGFQLSFVAVWALIFLVPKVERLLPGPPRWLLLGLSGTIAAQLATFPILVWHYGQAPIGGLGANLLAVPLAGVVLAAGMATCALGVIAPWAAPLPGWVTGASTRGMIWVSSAVAAIPGASLETARPSWVAIVGWYGALVGAGWWLGRRAEARSQPEQGNRG